MDQDPYKTAIQTPSITHKYSNKKFLIGLTIAVFLILSYAASIVVQSKKFATDERQKIVLEFDNAKKKCLKDPIVVTQARGVSEGSHRLTGTTSSQPILKDVIGHYCTVSDTVVAMKYRYTLITIDGKDYDISNFSAISYFEGISQNFYAPTADLSGYVITSKFINKYSKSYSVYYRAANSKSSTGTYDVHLSCTFDARVYFNKESAIEQNSRGYRITESNPGTNEKFYYLVHLPDTICSLTGLVELPKESAIGLLQSLKVADTETMLKYDFN